jgi:signal transduction histidine kinase
MRMRTKLLLCLLSISFGLTALSLLAVHRVVERQIRERLQSDLRRSMATYKGIELNRLHMLSRETALLADLPSLKALMTTEDRATIRDEGSEFYQVAGTDMLALADTRGESIACYLRTSGGGPAMSSRCPDLVRSSNAPYEVLDNRLYAIAAKPIYFGPPAARSLLGYVAAGYELSQALAEEIGQVAAAEVVFSAGGKIVATTLRGPRREIYAALPAGTGNSTAVPTQGGDDVWLGPEHYLIASLTLSGAPSSPPTLVVLKSYDEASRYLRSLDRLLAGIGGGIFLLGALLAVYLSGTITRPLEQLVAGIRGFSSGEVRHAVPAAGTREIRELSIAFEQMQVRLQSAQQELLQTERMATIGRMARSISHDLRHYLAAVYANAEFLGYDSTRPEERAELLADVKAGVQGMTDLIDSLLVFSRTGNALQLSAESIPQVIERAANMVRTHPDAQGVAVTLVGRDATEEWIDGRKIERALYNLLLNACQAARHVARPSVQVSLTEDEEWIRIFVADNGAGVADSIRSTLFQPFVSQGKQNGVGIGLTLAHHISQEHGGEVTLVESRPGKTVFSLSLARNRRTELMARTREPKSAAAPIDEH